jgi:tight adherence protein B
MEVIALLTLCSAFLAFYALMGLAVGGRIKVSQRVAVMTGNGKKALGRHGPRMKTKRTGVTWMSKLDLVLKRAEIDLQSREFVMRWVLISLCLSIAMYLVSGWIGIVLTLCCSALGTLIYLRMRAGRRSRKFNEGLTDMLTIITNSLRAGHSFTQAIHLVSQDMQGPIQEELVRIETEMQLGVGLEEALQRASDRVGSEDFDLIVTCIAIQRQIGGNLAEILERISDTIRDRVRLKREVKALTSQGRLSASIFMMLPIGVGIMLYLMNPEYMGAMFTNPLGIVMLMIAALGQVFGYLIIRRIVNIEL